MTKTKSLLFRGDRLDVIAKKKSYWTKKIKSGHAAVQT